MKLCRILLVLGIVVGRPSIRETLSFSRDPTFQAPALRYGPTHTNYHGFRAFTLTVGAVAVMFWTLFQPAAKRSRLLWATMAMVALADYGGWWLPWPILGLHTPNLLAELDHGSAAAPSGYGHLALATGFRRRACRRMTADRSIAQPASADHALARVA